MSTVLAALIGAFFGSIGTAVVQEWLRSRRERDEHREALVRRYLFQLQDAVEALWHRVYNVRHEGGKGAMTASYQASTTVYALGRVLAAERILTLEGVYPQLKHHYPELGETLQARRLSVGLGFAGFQQYDRIALARRSSSRTSVASARAPTLPSSSGTSRGRRARRAGWSVRGPRSAGWGRTRRRWMAGSTCWAGSPT